MTTSTYRGTIALDDYGETMDALYIVPPGQSIRDTQPIALGVREQMEEHGNRLSVRYFIAERETSLDDLTEDLVKRTAGVGDVRFLQRYSETTGYLWTDEWMKVGGHDLVAEIGDHEGKFCHLEFTFIDGEKHKDSMLAKEPM